MRIAIAGTHHLGKSTLAAALGDRLPGHRVVAEPYELMVARGYDFAEPPDREDYLAQLRQSLTLLRRPAPGLILDRSPLDFLGYLAALDHRHASDGDDLGSVIDLDRWRSPIAAGMASLDLVVLLRLNARNEPAYPEDDAAFRRDVDDWLGAIIGDDDWDLTAGVPVLALDGPWDERLAAILATLDRLPPGKR